MLGDGCSTEAERVSHEQLIMGSNPALCWALPPYLVLILSFITRVPSSTDNVHAINSFCLVVLPGPKQAQKSKFGQIQNSERKVMNW